jgi:hypothetical protein
MLDPNRSSFKGRLGRIERTHDAGGGFEADGALGMSYYNSHRRRIRRPRALGILIVAAIVLFGLKAGMHVAIGADAYNYKVAALQAGTDVDRVGAWLLRADPVTLAIAGQIRRVLN